MPAGHYFIRPNRSNDALWSDEFSAAGFIRKSIWTFPSTIDVAQKTFSLTEEEKLRILEASIGEGLFFAGAKHVAINVVASYAENQIITTAPGEIEKIKKAKKELKKSGSGQI